MRGYIIQGGGRGGNGNVTELHIKNMQPTKPGGWGGT